MKYLKELLDRLARAQRITIGSRSARGGSASALRVDAARVGEETPSTGVVAPEALGVPTTVAD